MLGVQPDIVLGDFDSIDPALLARLEDIQGLDIRKYDHHTKLETDTELAALATLQYNPRTILIFGAIGGRMDHSLANVFLLAHPALRDHDVRIIEGNQELFLARPAQWTTLRGWAGDTVSVFPLRGDAVGVKNSGLEYPLQGETVGFGTSRGVSNRMLADEASIWLDQGELLVIVAHLGQ